MVKRAVVARNIQVRLLADTPFDTKDHIKTGEKYMRDQIMPGWCSGSTTVSKTVSLGSIPSPGANPFTVNSKGFAGFPLTCHDSHGIIVVEVENGHVVGKMEVLLLGSRR